MDDRLLIPFGKRVFELRIAIRYLKSNFARLLGVTAGTLQSLESGETQPPLRTLRRLRIMERAFSEYLDKYHADVKRFHSKYTWGRETRVYDKYCGYRFRLKQVGYANSNILPPRKEDIEALGGMETFHFIKAETTQKGEVRQHSD
jgi:transcriptional regulator with XRE-family HTH domain